jgi:hypothetical protein
MTDLVLPQEVKSEIKKIAQEHGFTKVSFDEELPYEGFRRNFASTHSPTKIIYRYLFLESAIAFFEIDNTLFDKATRILTLHERTHHNPPFNSNPEVDEYLIQRQASAVYGNQEEFMLLDTLTCQFARIKFLEDKFLSEEVREHVNKYSWIDEEERSQAVALLSPRQHYQPENLRRILRSRDIIPRAEPLFR